MNSITLFFLLVCIAGCVTRVLAESTPVAVGVYDSRAVALAHFWSDAAKEERTRLIGEAKAAKAAGQTARFAELSARLSSMQRRDHLEVFSIAPANEALAALKDKLPGLQNELGVTRLVSKWDESALAEVPPANRVDVTDRLARELCPLTKEQQKMLESVKSNPPLPLEKARALDVQGKL